MVTQNCTRNLENGVALEWDEKIQEWRIGLAW